MNDLGKAVLLVFSNGLTASSKIPASRIRDVLLGQELWYIPRKVSLFAPGQFLVFYQSGVGFIGEAQLRRHSEITSEDSRLLVSLGLEFLQIRLELTDVKLYPNPVWPNDIVASLRFVTNKKYWGHSFRNTPRIISGRDLLLIRDTAKAKVTSPR